LGIVPADENQEQCPKKRQHQRGSIGPRHICFAMTQPAPEDDVGGASRGSWLGLVFAGITVALALVAVILL
jgi:hypothetical protein